MPGKVTISKGDQIKDKYTGSRSGKVRGSPIDPSMGNDTRLIGTVVLSKKEQGHVPQAPGKPSVTIKGRPGQGYK